MTGRSRPASRTACALGLSLATAVSAVGATAAPGLGASDGRQQSSADCEPGVIRANIRSAWTHVLDTKVSQVRAVDVGSQYAGTAEVLIFGEATATVWVRADACPNGKSSPSTERRTTMWVAIREGTSHRVEAGSRIQARGQAVEAASRQARRELRAIAIRRATRQAASVALAESAGTVDPG